MARQNAGWDCASNGEAALAAERYPGQRDGFASAADLKEEEIRRGTHRSTRALEYAIRLHVTRNSENLQRFVWLKTADEILASITSMADQNSAVVAKQKSAPVAMTSVLSGPW